MLARHLPAWFSVVALVGGCSEDGDSHVASVYRQYLVAVDLEQVFYCDCYVDLGYELSLASCWNQDGGAAVPPPVASCISDIIESSDSAADTYECLYSYQQEKLECLYAAGCGGDQLACDEIFASASQSSPCPELDPAIVREIEISCYGYMNAGTFECLSGDLIYGDLECDGMADCLDGSDEHLLCPETLFQCDNGEEVPSSWQCDGVPDCADESDESADCA